MRAAFSKAQFESELTGRFGVALKPREKKESAVVPTGLIAVDELARGFPRGSITEIFGLASSGRTTLILSALAEATTREEVCAIVDTTDAFHPVAAAEAGALLDRLLWLRCGARLESAFKATDLLLQGGGFGLVVLDLCDVPAKDARRIISSWWYRFRRVIEDTPTCLVVLTPEACVRSCAALTLELKGSSAHWSASIKSSAGRAVPLSLPAHANLLGSVHLAIERHKPIQPTERAGSFAASF